MKSVSGLRLQYTTLVLNSHFRLMSESRLVQRMDWQFTQGSAYRPDISALVKPYAHMDGEVESYQFSPRIYPISPGDLYEPTINPESKIR